MTKGDIALRQAYQEIPEKWYENFWLDKLSLIPTMLGYEFTLGNDLRPIVATHLISVGLTVVGIIADRYSTHTTIKSLQNAKNNNIPVYHEEAFPKYARLSGVIQDIPMIAFSLFDLGVGIGLFTQKIEAFGNNMRISKRYNRAIQIANS